METGAFYAAAKDYAEKIKNERPGFVTDEVAALCLIESVDNENFIGITGLTIAGDGIETTAAEISAVLNMRKAGKTKAAKIITVLFADYSVVKPDEEALRLLLAADSENEACEAAISTEEAVTAGELVTEREELVDFMAGFGFDDDISGFDADSDIFNVTGDDNDENEESESDDTENEADDTENEADGEDNSEAVQEAAQEGTDDDEEQAADFADGISIDESNPFFEPEAADAAPTNVLAEVEVTNESDNAVPSADGEPAKEVPSADTKKDKKAMSKGDLLKQAKKRKKVARANFNFRKK